MKRLILFLLLGMPPLMSAAQDATPPSIEVLKLQQNQDGTCTIFIAAEDSESGLDESELEVKYRHTDSSYIDYLYDQTPLDVSNEKSRDFDHVEGNIYEVTIYESGILPTLFENGEKVYWRIEAHDNAGNINYFPHDINYEALTTVLGPIENPEFHYVNYIVQGDEFFFDETELVPVESSSSAFTIYPDGDDLVVINNTAVYYAMETIPSELPVDGYTFFDEMPTPKPGLISLVEPLSRASRIQNVGNLDEVTVSFERKTDFAVIRNGWLMVKLLLSKFISIDDDIFFSIIDDLNDEDMGGLIGHLEELGGVDDPSVSEEDIVNGISEFIMDQYAEVLTDQINADALQNGGDFVSVDEVADQIGEAVGLVGAINTAAGFAYYVFRYPRDTEEYLFKRLSTFIFDYNWTPGVVDSYNVDSVFVGDTLGTKFRFRIPDEREQAFFNLYAEINIYAPGGDEPIETSRIDYLGYSPNGEIEVVVDELEVLPDSLAPYGFGQGNAYSPNRIGSEMTYSIRDYLLDSSSEGFSYESYKEPYGIEFILYQGGVPHPLNPVLVDTIGRTAIMEFMVFDHIAPEPPEVELIAYSSEYSYYFYVSNPDEKDIAEYVIYRSFDGTSPFLPIDTVSADGNLTLYKDSYNDGQDLAHYRFKAIDISGNEGVMSEPLLADPPAVAEIVGVISLFDLDLYQPDEVQLFALDAAGNSLAGVPIQLSSNKDGFFETDLVQFYDNGVRVVTDDGGFSDFNYFPLISGNHTLTCYAPNGISFTHTDPIIVSTETFDLGGFGDKFIVEFQYWIDNNTAEIQSYNTTPKTLLDYKKSLYIHYLPQGLHLLNCRFKDNEGQYSSLLRYFFIRRQSWQNDNKIALYQYWIDDAEALTQVNNPDQGDFLLLENLDISNLSNGLHKLSIRTLDRNNRWSSLTSYSFLKSDDAVLFENDIEEVEYWIDEPDSIISISANDQIEYEFVDSIDVSALSDGLHQLNLRVRDKTGVWSALIMHPFLKVNGPELSTNGIVEFEYWVDEPANRTSGSFAVAENFVFLEDLDLTLLEKGLHRVSVRFKDEKIGWSSLITHVFYYDGNQLIPENALVGYRYWFRDEPNVFTEIDDQSQVSQIYQNEVQIPQSFPAGEYQLMFQAQDSNGLWSGPVSELLTIAGIEPCTASISGSIDFENFCSERDGTLRIYGVGSDVMIEEIVISVDLDGNFTAESTPIGDFDLYVKVNGYLQKLNANVPLSGGDNTVNFEAVIAGDISGNNQINVTDFSQFSSVYGLNTENDGFLPLADFNCDGAINVQDFSFFSANYGLVGDQP